MLLMYVLGVLGIGAVSLIGSTAVTAVVNKVKEKRNASASQVASVEETEEVKEENIEKVVEQEKAEEKINEENTKKVVAKSKKNANVSTKTKSIETLVSEKMNSSAVKKLVGKSEEKAKYLRAFLTNAATKQQDNGNSVEELMDHKTMNETLIPRVCSRIDRFLFLKKETTEQFLPFEKDGNEKYVKEQKTAIVKKMRTLEKEMMENSKNFDSSVENYEADLLKVVADMKKGKYVTGLMEDVVNLQKGAAKSQEQIANIYNELEKHGYDLKLLAGLGLVDMSNDIKKNKNVIVNLYNRMQNVEQKLEECNCNIKTLESVDLVNLKNKVNELEANGSINEEDAKVIYATCINNYVNSIEFEEKVQSIIKNTEITVTEKMTKNARKTVIKELYDTIINEGELDQKKFKETIDSTVKDIIENRLSVKKGKN